MSQLDIKEETFSIKVDNIDSDTTLDDLKYVFSKFGNVSNIYIPKKRNMGIKDPKEVRCILNYCFIRYFTKAEADKAIEKLHGKDVNGRVMSLTFEKNRRYIQECEKQIQIMSAKGMDTTALERAMGNERKKAREQVYNSSSRDESYKRDYSPKREHSPRYHSSRRDDRFKKEQIDDRYSRRDERYRKRSRSPFKKENSTRSSHYKCENDSYSPRKRESSPRRRSRDRRDKNFKKEYDSRDKSVERRRRRSRER